MFQRNAIFLNKYFFKMQVYRNLKQRRKFLRKIVRNRNHQTLRIIQTLLSGFLFNSKIFNLPLPFFLFYFVCAFLIFCVSASWIDSVLITCCQCFDSSFLIALSCNSFSQFVNFHPFLLFLSRTSLIKMYEYLLYRFCTFLKTNLTIQSTF